MRDRWSVSCTLILRLITSIVVWGMVIQPGQAARTAEKVLIDVTLPGGKLTCEIARLYPDRVVVLKETGEKLTLTPKDILKASNPQVEEQIGQAKELLERIQTIPFDKISEASGQLEQSVIQLQGAARVYEWLLPEAQSILGQLEKVQPNFQKALEVHRRLEREFQRIRDSAKEGEAPGPDLRKTFESAQRWIAEIPSERTRLEAASWLAQEKAKIQKSLQASADLSNRRRRDAEMARIQEEGKILSQAKARLAELAQRSASTDLSPVTKNLLLKQLDELAADLPPSASRQVLLGRIEPIRASLLASSSGSAIISATTPANLPIPSPPATQAPPTGSAARKDGHKGSAFPILVASATAVFILAGGLVLLRRRRMAVPARPQSTPVKHPKQMRPSGSKSRRKQASKKPRPSPAREQAAVESPKPIDPEPVPAPMAAVEQLAASPIPPESEEPLPFHMEFEAPQLEGGEKAIFGNRVVSQPDLEDKLREGVILAGVAPVSLWPLGNYFGLAGRSDQGMATLVLVDRRAPSEQAFLTTELPDPEIHWLTGWSGAIWVGVPAGVRVFIPRDATLDESAFVGFDSWCAPPECPPVPPRPPLWFGDDHLILPVSQGLLVALEVSREENRITIREVWRTRLEGALASDLLRIEDQVGFLDTGGHLMGLDPSTGQVQNIGAGHLIHPPKGDLPPVALSGGKSCCLIRTDEQVEVCILDAAAGSVLSRAPIPSGAPMGFVTVEEGAVLVTDQEIVFFEDPGLAIRWKYPLEGKTPRQFSVGDHEVSFLARDQDGRDLALVLGKNSGSELWQVTTEEAGMSRLAGMRIETGWMLLWGEGEEGSGVLRLMD